MGLELFLVMSARVSPHDFCPGECLGALDQTEHERFDVLMRQVIDSLEQLYAALS